MTLSSRRNKRITFQAPNGTISPTGVVTATWATLCTRWANVVPPKKVEPYLAVFDISEGLVVLRVPGDSATRQIAERYRAVLNGRILDVVSVVDPDGNGKALVVVCRERTND